MNERDLFKRSQLLNEFVIEAGATGAGVMDYMTHGYNAITNADPQEEIDSIIAKNKGNKANTVKALRDLGFGEYANRYAQQPEAPTTKTPAKTPTPGSIPGEGGVNVKPYTKPGTTAPSTADTTKATTQSDADKSSTPPSTSAQDQKPAASTSTSSTASKTSSSTQETQPKTSAPKDPMVLRWQKFLNERGADLAEDGIYGPLTQGAYDTWKEQSAMSSRTADINQLVQQTGAAMQQHGAIPQQVPSSGNYVEYERAAQQAARQPQFYNETYEVLAVPGRPLREATYYNNSMQQQTITKVDPLLDIANLVGKLTT